LNFPPHLLDELARVFARAAVEAFLAATVAAVAAVAEEEGVAKSDNDSSDLTLQISIRPRTTHSDRDGMEVASSQCLS
jgi:hypothetical protein